MKDEVFAYFCTYYEIYPVFLQFHFLQKEVAQERSWDTAKHTLLSPPLSALLTFINCMRLNNATSTVCEFCTVDWSTTSTGGKEQLQLLKTTVI